MDDYSSVMAYPSTPSDYGYSNPATITMGEMSLLTPTSPESLCSMNIKGEYREHGEYDEHEDREDSPKQSRKRKSWGQELPTPKTNLPPRKRAKTEDEKEQRRIERVLRNRQAAQSSRERKRQEVEKLEGEKLAIERQNQLLRERLMAVEHEKFKLGQQIAKMAAEMSVFRGTSLSRGPSASPLSRAVSCTPSPEFDKDFLELAIKQELEDHPYSASTSQTTIDPRSSGFSSLPPSEYSDSPSPPDFDFDLVSVRESMSTTDSAYDSRRSSSTTAKLAADTREFHVSPLSDDDFDRLFESPSDNASDLKTLSEAFDLPENLDDAPTGQQSDEFQFDSMVDLNACQSHNDTLINFDDASFYMAPTDFMHGTAAMSSGLQPCLGAAS